MNEIKRVPEKVSGVKGSVQLDAKCVHTRFFKDRMKQTAAPCTLMASWENCVLSITYTADGQKYALSVRLDETLELLAAANDARAKRDGGGRHEPEGNP